MRRLSRRAVVLTVSVMFGVLVFVTRTIWFNTRPRLLPSEASVRHVVDGDTFQLTNGLVVRLSEIDAPELYGPQSDLAEAARIELHNTIYRRSVRLEAADPHRDAYGRFLAYVLLAKRGQPDEPEVFVNAEIARRGLARAATWRVAGPRFDAIRQAEADARAARRGIWREAPPASAGAGGARSESAAAP